MGFKFWLQIAKLQQLEILDVSYSALTGKGLLEIVDGCHALRVLSVDGCKISMLSMLAAIRARPELRMWEKGTAIDPGRSNAFFWQNFCLLHVLSSQRSVEGSMGLCRDFALPHLGLQG